MSTSSRNSRLLAGILVFTGIIFGLASAHAQVTTILSPNYTIADLHAGDRYYLDRTFTLTSVPGQLAGGVRNGSRHETTIRTTRRQHFCSLVFPRIRRFMLLMTQERRLYQVG